MKKIFVVAVLALFCATAYSQEPVKTAPTQSAEVVVDDYQIVSDEMKDGVRCIVATPSAKVCSKKIEIEIIGDTIMKVVYTRGCQGNAKGIGALIKGMSVDEAIRRLDGITCGSRPTSCPDQLSRILKALK